MAVKHPCAGLSKGVVEVFESIAVSQPHPHRPAAILTLLHAGLIVQIGERVLRDRFGEVRIPVYEVPLPVHYQWCQWCSENVPDDDL